MNGRQHEMHTAGALALGGAVIAALLGWEEAVAFMGSGLISSLYLSPDLDLRDSRPSRRWGLLSLLWEPYRLLHPHRGRSHTYLYGPLSRLAYVGLPLYLLLKGALPEMSLSLPASVWASLLSGYLLGQWAHLWQDRIKPSVHRL